MRKSKLVKLAALALASVCAIGLLAGCSSSSGSAPVTSNGEHPTITMNAPYRNMSKFQDLVHEKYPEINLEVIPYNGANTSAYMTDMRKSGQMTDIFFNTVYTPGRLDDENDFLDMSGFDFTDNYVQSRLREVTYNGGIYMLPLGYNALGITYNKTLFQENGWSLPTNLTELEQLKAEAEAKGYTFCRDQLQLPGYGFQYLCNIADTGFLGTTEGLAWQDAFLKGETTVESTPEMIEALQLLNRWRDMGMLNGDGTPDDDSATRQNMVEGNTLFLVGNSSDIKAELPSDCDFSLMPYLSEDGKQNVFVLNVSRYVGLNKHLADAGNEQKLEDAKHVMKVLSTVEGMELLDSGQNNSRLLPLKDATVGEDSYYADVVDQLNAGNTAPFIYAGWENVVVPVGQKMLDYVCGKATLDDVIACFDENQHLITDDDVTSYTTVTETIGTEDCAKLVGIGFAQATGADAALISVNTPVYDPESTALNANGVSGSLFPLPVSDQEITSITPTGWKANIQTVTLTGARIKELAEQGYDCHNNGIYYPYVLATKEGTQLDDNTTYKVAICGVTDEIKAEGNLTDSGVMGLTAMQNYLKQFDTLSAKDIVWK